MRHPHEVNISRSTSKQLNRFRSTPLSSSCTSINYLSPYKTQVPRVRIWRIITVGHYAAINANLRPNIRLRRKLRSSLNESNIDCQIILYNQDWWLCNQYQPAYQSANGVELLLLCLLKMIVKLHLV